uniref:Uncharacterized protein n=1 Tax=Sphaerodactylus townsendi TaxID=933632 RepID=A0ACB8FJS8_9SAUR
MSNNKSRSFLSIGEEEVQTQYEGESMLVPGIMQTRWPQPLHKLLQFTPKNWCAKEEPGNSHSSQESPGGHFACRTQLHAKTESLHTGQLGMRNGRENRITQAPALNHHNQAYRASQILENYEVFPGLIMFMRKSIKEEIQSFCEQQGLLPVTPLPREP